VQGKILDYSIQNSAGVISGDDGQRYNFISAEWKSDKAPASGQIVDFSIDGINAMALYLVSSSNALEDKLSEIKDSEMVNTLVSNGMQHTTGFIVSLLLAFSLFLPVIDAGMFGSVSFMDGGFGKLLFLVFLGVAFLYYSGIQKKLLKIIVIISSAVVLLKFMDLISGFVELSSRDMNLFGLLGIGTYIVLPLTIAFLVIGVTAKFKN
jgi:hypothetical protein